MAIPYIKTEDHLCKYCGASATSCNNIEDYQLCGNGGNSEADNKEL